MLLGIALLYMLLCVRVRVRLEGSFEDGKGSAVLGVGALGIHLRREYALVIGTNGLAAHAVKRCGEAKKKKNPASAWISRFMKDYAIKALRSGRFDHLVIHVHLGLGDACATAIAAGAVHALACSALAAWGSLRVCDLSITPEFDRLCLRARGRSVFACQTGDMLLAAIKAALNHRKEGRR